MKVLDSAPRAGATFALIMAFLRFTGGAGRAAALLVASILAWIVLPAAAAARRLSRVDL